MNYLDYFSSKTYLNLRRSENLAKNSKEQIEEDEIKVINKLQENSNENIGEIAKKCGFSRQKAWRIIKKLEEEKTIWGYRAIINNEKTNMNGFVLLIKGKRLPIENNFEKDIVERKIDKIAEEMGITVNESYWLHGSYDGMIGFSAKNLKQAKKFQEKYLKTFDGNILELNLLEKMVVVKEGGFVNPKILKSKSLLDS
jgi:DNA-binding Lrp family transcriptional regulator